MTAAFTDHPGEVSAELAERARGLGLVNHPRYKDEWYVDTSDVKSLMVWRAEVGWYWAPPGMVKGSLVNTLAAALLAACEWLEAQRAPSAMREVGADLLAAVEAMKPPACRVCGARPETCVQPRCIFGDRVPAAPAPTAAPTAPVGDPAGARGHSFDLDGDCAHDLDGFASCCHAIKGQPSEALSCPVSWAQMCEADGVRGATSPAPAFVPLAAASENRRAEVDEIQQRLDATEADRDKTATAIAEVAKAFGCPDIYGRPAERVRWLGREIQRHRQKDARALDLLSGAGLPGLGLAEGIANLVTARDEARAEAQEQYARADRLLVERDAARDLGLAAHEVLDTSGAPTEGTLADRVRELLASLAEANAEIERLTLAHPVDTLAAMARKARENAARIEMLERGIVGLVMRLGVRK